MLPSRGFLRTGQSLGLGRRARPLAPFSASTRTRLFGTALRNNAGSSATTAKRIGGPLAALSASSRQPLFSNRQVRYASTQPTVPPQTVPSPGADLPTGFSSQVDLNHLDLLNIPEQIGFMKALGLDYGWGPTSMMQWCLEHIYVYTGVPWWAAIGLTALAVRIAIFKPSLEASKQSQVVQDLRKHPRYQKAMEQMKLSMMDKSGDPMASLAAKQEIQQIHKAAGFKFWKTLIPMVNIPLGYGMFRLLKGMGELPIPTMLSGGLLWFPDLTVPDPFFILPVAASAVMFMALRIPLPYMAPEQQKTMKLMSIFMLPLGGIFSIWFPSGLQLYFLASAALQYVQSSAFYNPTLRMWFGLRKLIVDGEVDEGPTPKTGTWQAPRTLDTTATPVEEPKAKSRSSSVFDAAKGGWESAKDKIQEMAAKKERETAAKSAREYDEKRTLEDQERLAARREARLRKRREEE